MGQTQFSSRPTSYHFGACRRCGGTLSDENDFYGDFQSCINCGDIRYYGTPPEKLLELLDTERKRLDEKRKKLDEEQAHLSKRYKGLYRDSRRVQRIH